MRALTGIALLLVGCVDPVLQEMPEVVARGRDIEIKGQALMLRALRQYGDAKPVDWLPIIERLLDDEIDLNLLAFEAEKRGVKPSEDALETAIASLKSRYPAHQFRRSLDALALRPIDLRRRARLRLLAEGVLRLEAGVESISDAAVANWKAKNPMGEKLLVRHLLTASQSQAKEAVSLYKKRRFSFADLVRRFSKAPEASQGGLLPAFERGELPAVFDQAFSLKMGEVSDPLESEHGWHVLRLEDRQAAGVASDDIARRAVLRRREGALQGQLIARLRLVAGIDKVPGALPALAALLQRAQEAQ
jgi:parvulin-like peptidyl-prolyl isomerase